MQSKILESDETLFMNSMETDMRNMVNENSIIYKYLDFETGKIILQNSTLAFKNPLEMNDPYDCSLSLFDFTKVPTDYRKKLVSKYFNHLNRLERRKIIAQFSKKSNHSMSEILMNGMKKDQETRGLTCFSKNFNNLLMWSHYGRSHSGICIGFDMAKLYMNISNHSHPERMLVKVKYETDFNVIDYFKHPKESVINWLRAKSIDWKYEEEIRLILYDLKFGINGLHIQSIERDCVKCVYLGSKISIENENCIREIITSKYSNVIIKKLILNKNRYELISE